MIDQVSGRAARQEMNVAEAVARLQADNDQLKLYVASLLSLLIQSKVVSPEQFEQISQVIDRADGVEDGQFSGMIKPDVTLTLESRYNDQHLRELAQVVQSIR